MVAVYLDSGSLADMRKYADRVAGFTTNPALMRKEGIEDYRSYAKVALEIAAGKPISFEVLADDFATMEKQAREIASWGKNVWVKIPIQTTDGKPTTHLLHAQVLGDINLNVTAVMTYQQIYRTLDWLKPTDILSVFVGRITDTGVSAMSGLAPALGYQKMVGKRARILWASAREVWNYYQAEEYGVDIITLSPDLLEKLALRGRNLEEYSRSTVQQFHNDGKAITW